MEFPKPLLAVVELRINSPLTTPPAPQHSFCTFSLFGTKPSTSSSTASNGVEQSSSPRYDHRSLDNTSDDCSYENALPITTAQARTRESPRRLVVDSNDFVFKNCNLNFGYYFTNNEKLTFFVFSPNALGRQVQQITQVKKFVKLFFSPKCLFVFLLLY